MANTERNVRNKSFQYLSEYANIDANYGPWSSSSEYETWLGGTVLPGTLIAIHNQTTDEVTLKIYSKGTWVDVCSGNHDDEDESDDPSPIPPDPQPPETVTLVSIAVSGQTTSYQVGDTFSFDGTCTATYSDNSQQVVTPTSVSTPSMSTFGIKTITVSYTENGITKTTTYTISVAAPVVKTASFIAVLRTVKNATTGKDTEVTYDSVEKGTVITYKVTIQNNGNVNLTGGKVTSTLPDVQDITFTFNPCSSYTYTHTVTQADVDTGFIHNKITASAKSAESGVANPTDVTKEMRITTVAASPSLTITKSANTSAAFTITTGTNIPYTITVKNTGNVTLSSGTITDSKFKDFNNTFSLLAPGNSKNFTYTYKVIQADVNNGKIENTATASNIIAARGVNPSSISATKTIVIPGPVTPIEPIEPAVPDNLDFADLILPSGTLWAKTNIGAEVETDLGTLFAWGETQPKSSYSWSNYKYCNGTKKTLTKYCTNVNYWDGTGEIDNKIVLDPEDDAATQLWGSEWCMPTSTQLSELFATDMLKIYTTKIYNGVKVGGVEVYKTNGLKGIFIPISILDENGLSTTGYYRSTQNSFMTDFASDALQVYLEDGTIHAGIVRNQYRYKGMFIRPVYYKKVEPVTSVSILNSDNRALTNIQLSLNSSIVLHAGITPSNATDQRVSWSLNYSSSDPCVQYTVIKSDVVRGASSVKVTAVSRGTCTLKCTSTNRYRTTQCIITVV